MREIRSTVKDFIMTTFLPGEAASALGDGENLLANGVLNSLGMLKLVGYVESEFDIEVGPTEANAENFGTIDTITAYVAGKVGGGAEASL